MATKLSATNRRGGGVRYIPILETRSFPGTYSYPKPQQIPRGAAAQSLNFLTRDTWVEQRPGYHPLGTEVTGAGKCLGIKTAHLWDGTQIIFKATLDGKLKWYDPLNTSGQGAADMWSEVGGAGANILAAAATVGENVYMDEYVSSAGAQLWVSSPSSDLIKIMVASPVSWLSQYNAAKNFKGRIRVIQNSLFLWHYKATSTSAAANSVLQRSYIDEQDYSTQTDSAVALTIAGAAVSGTLSKNSVANATVFGLDFSYSDTAYSETFLDDYLGNLIGSNGGTGTIDYSTGKFTLTPHVVPAAPVVNVTYSYEDSTNHGIADFTKDSPRAAGQGVAWIQVQGGQILGVNPYNGSYYVLHERNAWVITPSDDDSTSTNIIYRDNIALPSERGSVATPDGIYYVDVSNASRPFVGLLSYSPISQQVLPDDLSSPILDLTPYVFDKCVADQGLDFILLWCRTSDSIENNRCVVYNKNLSSSKRRVFDILDYMANCSTIYEGQVIAGDPISNNAFKLFDGFDEDGGIINSYWQGNEDDHGIEGLKQTKKLWVEGYIGVNQQADVYVQLDANVAVKVGTISGSGTYVDQGLPVTIGSLQVGVYPIGGPANVPVGYHYLIQITINSAKYKYFTISFFPTQVGYFSFQMYANYDIRINVDKLPRKYRDNPTFNSPNSGTGGGGTITPYSIIRTVTPTGAIDGVNKIYTVQFAIHTVFNFILNGEDIDSSQYTLSADGLTITFTNPLPQPLAGTPFEIVYE